MHHDNTTAELRALLASLKSSLDGNVNAIDKTESPFTDNDGILRFRLPQDLLPDHRALRRFQLMV